jgi:uncharacterized OB-fold protein
MKKDILGYRCRKCGEVHYPIRYRCRKCGHSQFDEGSIVMDAFPLPRAGRLLTYTHVYALPPDFEAVSLGLGVVELDNGQRVTGQIRIPEPKTGMRVRAEVDEVRKETYATYYGFVFYPEA